MRSLLNFIYKYHYFILFILLECLSFFFLIQYNDYQRSSFMNSSSKMAGGIYNISHGVSQYFGLKEKNQILNHTLADYLNQDKSAYKKNSISLLEVHDSVYLQQYVRVPAEVINNSTSRNTNFLTLNVGWKHGVTPGMAVVAPAGVVGVVKDVSDNFASVISLLNQNLKISALVKKNNYFGTLNWEGGNPDYATLHDLPNHIDLIQGDTIITSGFSAMFPKGEIIGWVDDVDDSDGGGFLTVKVRLSVDFRRLDNVFVIKNLLKDEQVRLERASVND